ADGGGGGGGGAGGGERAAPPPGPPPHLWRASASQEDGKVVLQIARAWAKASRPREQPAADVLVWDNLRKVTLGETVQAYGVGGEPVDPKVVLAALAKP